MKINLIRNDHSGQKQGDEMGCDDIHGTTLTKIVHIIVSKWVKKEERERVKKRSSKISAQKQVGGWVGRNIGYGK